MTATKSPDALESLLGRHWHHLPASEVIQLLETNSEWGDAPAAAIIAPPAARPSRAARTPSSQTQLPRRRRPWSSGPRRSAAFTRPFVAVTSIDDTVFRWIMWRDPQETPRGFSARFAALRADIKAKKTRSAATGVTASLKGYDAVTRYGEQYKNNVSRNVIAKIEGTDPSLKAQYVITGGHLDHTGVTNGVIFNGADDNASGAATVMEVARALAAGKAQPKRTLVFALWTGEEEGLIGSQVLLGQPDRRVEDGGDCRLLQHGHGGPR